MKPARGDRLRKIRWVLGLVRPYRLRAILMLLLVLVSTGTALLPPWLAGKAIDSGVVPGDGTALAVITGILILAVIVNAAASWLQTWLVGWIGIRVLQDLREQVFMHVQRMSIGFFSRIRPGTVISRMTNDVEALNQLVSDGIVTLFGSLLTVFGTVAVMYVLDWRLATVTLGVLPLLVGSSFLFRRYSTTAFRRTRERIAAITAYLQETLSGVRVVRAFGREDHHLTRMTELNELNRQTNMTTVYLNAAYFPTTELLTAFGTAAILAFGGWQAIQGNLGIGVVVAFIGYLNLFFQPIQQLAQLYATYQQGMAALDKIFDLLDTEVDLTDAPDAVAPERLEGRVTFDDVSFSYELEGGAESGAWAVEDINLEIEPGQTVALVGATGAGKSTLAKLVTRFHDPQQGTVSIDGRSLPHWQQRPLRRHMGIVPQEGFLFSGTIAENIAFGRPEADREEIDRAATEIGADNFIEGLPDRYDTEVGERGIQLSSGQRQLIALARVVLAEPSLLVLDEATSAVDTRTERLIEAALERTLSDRTAIVIAHRLSTIRNADRIVVMDRGRILESGTHEELLQSGGQYSRLYGSWTENAGLDSSGTGDAAGSGPAGTAAGTAT